MNDSSEFARQRLQAASRAKDIAKRLAWVFLIGATILEMVLGVALVDYWLMLSPRLRMGGFMLLLLFLAVGVGGWIKLRRRPTSMKEAALDTEAQRPDLGCVISTAAEYTSGERIVAHEYEPELVAALEEQAAKNLRKVQLSYFDRLVRPAGFLAFTLVTLLVFTVAAPVALTALKRTVAPWSKETYTKVEVRPGNADVPVGSDLAVTNLFSGRVPKNPALRWQEFEQPTWQSVALTKSEDGYYRHPFRNLQSSIHYQVTGNDAASEVYEVTTYVPPEVRELHVGVAYPEYTRVQPFEQQSPELTVLRASDLSLRITPSTTLSKAHLRFSAQPGIDLTQGADGQWTGHFKATADTDYWIELADAKGHRGGNEKPFHLKVLPDQPPKVEIVNPGQDIRADATNTIPLKIAASDDFGLGEIKIVYHRLGGPEQVVNCSYTNAGEGEVSGGVDLALAGLGLKEYEVVAYHAEAKDNNTLDGPGKGASPVYFIEITNEEAGKGKPKPDEEKANLLAIQKQIIADTTALATNADAEQFGQLASRQKQATDFAGIYHDTLSSNGAPAEALKLMQDALDQMKAASGSLAGRKRDPALPPEEKALADLYQVMKVLPHLGNLPVEPPAAEEQEPPKDPSVKVALKAIKKKKQQEEPSIAELARALEEAKQLSRSQAAVLQDTERPGQSPDTENKDSEAAKGDGKSDAGKEGQGAKDGTNPGDNKGNQEAKAKAQADAEKQKLEAKANPGERKNTEAKPEPKPKDEKGNQEAKTPDDKKENQLAFAGNKSGDGKGDQEGKGEKAGQGKGGQQAQPGEKPGDAKANQQTKGGGRQPGGGKKGQQAHAEAQPGEPQESEGLEKLAELENELSKEAAALAEQLEKLAIKDTRLGHNAAKKAAQAAGQMGAAAQALRQGNRGAAGTEGGQGLMNLDKVIAALEHTLKDQPKLTDVATEDFPKEYEALISEYLRKLSHEQ
jgi:hypothetical protein